ncbi:MAG TPA: hypothetical protein VET65_00955 [Candidatus Limnocylindrales bacterium]|nr:hypothetical protein [Candidatus Limnocylindrales bacterium]
MEGFAPTFKEAVGRWRRRHRHPPANETWYAVHYRVGWLVERLNTLESIHLMRQGLDVRALAAERPARKRKADGKTGEAAELPDQAAAMDAGDEVSVEDGDEDDEVAEDGGDETGLDTVKPDAGAVTPVADAG